CALLDFLGDVRVAESGPDQRHGNAEDLDALDRQRERAHRQCLSGAWGAGIEQRLQRRIRSQRAPPASVAATRTHLKTVPHTKGVTPPAIARSHPSVVASHAAPQPMIRACPISAAARHGTSRRSHPRAASAPHPIAATTKPTTYPPVGPA